jgi:hypothetical protein
MKRVAKANVSSAIWSRAVLARSRARDIGVQVAAHRRAARRLSQGRFAALAFSKASLNASNFARRPDSFALGPDVKHDAPSLDFGGSFEVPSLFGRELLQNRSVRRIGLDLRGPRVGRRAALGRGPSDSARRVTVLRTTGRFIAFSSSALSSAVNVPRTFRDRMRG